MGPEKLSAHKEFDPPAPCQTGLRMVVAVPGNGEPSRDLWVRGPCAKPTLSERCGHGHWERFGKTPLEWRFDGLGWPRHGQTAGSTAPAACPRLGQAPAPTSTQGLGVPPGKQGVPQGDGVLACFRQGHRGERPSPAPPGKALPTAQLSRGHGTAAARSPRGLASPTKPPKPWVTPLGWCRARVLSWHGGTRGLPGSSRPGWGRCRCCFHAGGKLGTTIGRGKGQKRSWSGAAAVTTGLGDAGRAKGPGVEGWRAELLTRGRSSSPVISRGLPSSGETRCSRGRGKPVPSALLTCEINDEPAILLLLLLDNGFGLLQALRCAAVAEEEAGETLKHGGEWSSGTGRELGLPLSTGFQTRRWERWAARGKTQHSRSRWRPRCFAASEIAAELNGCSAVLRFLTWLQCKSL